MKVFVTGGTGFIGGEIVRQLRARGDEVVCLVRSPEKGKKVAELGCELVAGNLGDERVMREAMAGCDGVIHAAAVYEIGIPIKEQAAMREANVAGTERVLSAALEAKVAKVVYVSTMGIGQTYDKVVDESFEAPDGPFTSCYEETKWQAHQVAKRMIAAGLPCTIVQPGGVYGPGDTSSIAELLDQFFAGKLPLLPFPELGICLAHVEDTAAGIVLALDKGAAGETYIIAGPTATMREAVDVVAKLGGRKAPKRAMPTGMLKALAPIGPLVGKMTGQPPNLRELITAADGVTYWGTNEKAKRELGYEPRGLEDGFRDMLAVEGRLASAAA